MIEKDIKTTEELPKIKEYGIIFGKMSFILSVASLIIWILIIANLIPDTEEFSILYVIRGLAKFLQSFFPIPALIFGIISLVKKTPKKVFPIIGIVISLLELIIPILFYMVLMMSLITTMIFLF